MGTAWFAVLGVLFVIFQAAAAEESSCVPGFESELLIFKMTRKHLKQGTRLGKVGFSDCTGRTRFLFTTDDSRFVVQTDGVVTVKRQIVLHEGHRDFFIHSWDSQGQKLTVPAMVLYVGHHHGNNHPNSEQHHNIQLRDQVEMDSATKQDAPQVPILNFPRPNPGLKRRKRDWVIPPLNVAENSRGPYPLSLAQIRSDEDKVKKIIYRISGPGADQPPVNLFTMDRHTGHLYVTQVLDREKQDEYRLQAHAEAVGGGANAEAPMEIVIIVIDQNDNKPVFNQSTYTGEVPEASKKGFEVIKVVATDADEPNTDNSDIRYRIMGQIPEDPSPNMFNINPITGLIILNQAGLDREKNSQYTLDVQVADMKGEGLTGFTKVLIAVTDSNDHAPVFTEASYTATVEENKVDALVVKMLVTDGDYPQSPAWNAKFKIIDGNKENLFTVETGTNKQEGIITTAKGLDFERVSKHTLLVTVVNEEPFAVPLITSTATVVVTVEDVNEPPIFDPKEKRVSKPEDLKKDSTVVRYTASDPDIVRKQKVMYKILKDPAGWLDIEKETGVIKVRNQMDRESPLVKEDKYTALIGAYDDDQMPATGTGTLIITLEDVNDNAPFINNRLITMCNKKPVPQLLTVTDIDGPGFTFPYSVLLQDSAKVNWTAQMNDNKTAIILTLTRELESGTYTVGMEVSDYQLKGQVNTVKVELCDCSGEEVSCKDKVIAGSSMPVILGILGGVLLLLMLVLLLLLLANKNKPKKEQPLLLDNDVRDDIFFYDEEGGGEEDQDYFDLGVLHRGLDNRPHVFRDEVAPVFQSRPVVYKPRPTNPEDIGGFIDDNLKAADNDPTAPPYDSLLVFDYEGGGSEAGSISSLNSSSDGDQDYDCLSDWGPRFKKLADMYGGGDDDDMM